MKCSTWTVGSSGFEVPSACNYNFCCCDFHSNCYCYHHCYYRGDFKGNYALTI